MGTMNKLRENTGVVLWILVISFGVIWVLQDSGAFNVVGNPGAEMIVVDGDAVTYDEYNRALNAQIDAYQEQTGEPMPPQRLDQERDRVFEALVDNKLREREMERLGITVTDDEVYDLVLGDDPHPIIRAYFGDGQGNVDQALLQNFVDDPEAREQWIQLENYLRAERRRQKLDNLIAATVRVTEQDVEAEYRKRNLQVAADYVVLRYASVPNEEVELDESDLRAYYNENREDYARPRSYTVQVAQVSKLPTPADTAAALESIGRLKPTFANAENDSLFLEQYGSERTYGGDVFFRRDELEPALADIVFQNPEPGTIVGPVVAGDLAHLIKIIDVRPAEETAVKARHILIQPEGDSDAAQAAAREQAQELKQQIQNGADFGGLARAFSDDVASGSRGGDLGWFGPGRMVQPFEEAAFEAPIGQVVGPVETDFGYHLIEVQARANQEVKLADYAESLRASTESLSDAEEKLEDLRYFAEDAGFTTEAERLGFETQEILIEEEQRAVPGLGYSARLLNFLEDADAGDLSDVIELNDKFIVVSVESVTPEGYRPFDEVRAEVEARAALQRKREIVTERLEQAYENGGFEGLAERVGERMRTQAGISFNNMQVSGLGRDPIFAGTVLGLNEGAVSGVVQGENGAFVARVTNVNEPGPITDAQRQQIRQQLLTQRRGQIQRQWMESLRTEADIEDNRRQFFQ